MSRADLNFLDVPDSLRLLQILAMLRAGGVAAIILPAKGMNKGRGLELEVVGEQQPTCTRGSAQHTQGSVKPDWEDCNQGRLCDCTNWEYAYNKGEFSKEC